MLRRLSGLTRVHFTGAVAACRWFAGGKKRSSEEEEDPRLYPQNRQNQDFDESPYYNDGPDVMSQDDSPPQW